MNRRDIAARLIIAEYMQAEITGDLKMWLKIATYEAWEDAGVIAAALDECERNDGT